MDESLESKKQSGTANKTVIIAVIVVLLAAIAVLAFFLLRRDNKNVIGYATEARVMLDQESLQAAMDEARRNAAGNSVGLRYQNDAYSEDGTTFTCRIINSEVNLYDMFLTIFADAELTDQIFLSGLVPPGSGFESITLDHANVVTAPTEAWEETDGFNATVAFTFSPVKTYTITVGTVSNSGSVTVSPTSAPAGATVTITGTGANAETAATYTVTPADTNIPAITVTPDPDDALSGTFTMPASNVTITGSMT